MKKRNILLIVSMICVIGLFCMSCGSSDQSDEYEEKDNTAVDVKEEVDISHKGVEANNYLTFKNIKIRDDFKGFEKSDDSNPDGSMDKYVLYDKNGDIDAEFWMGYGVSYVDALKEDDLLGDEDIDFDGKEFLKDNNITNDVELFKYLNDNKDKKSYINNVMDMLVPMSDGVTLLKGDYLGYILDINTSKEVGIVKDGVKYLFDFVNTEYFTDKKINDLISTIVIE